MTKNSQHIGSVGGNLLKIDENIQKAFIQKDLQLKTMLDSGDPDQIWKAQQYLEISQKDKGKSDLKSYIFAPEAEMYSGLGYKDTLKGVSYNMERMMAKVPQIQSIILTRKEQVKNFTGFTLDLQEEGWTIQKKRSIFDKDEEVKLNNDDKKKIEYIKNFIENGGEVGKWDITDDFEQFAGKFVDDTYTLDQVCFELERTRGKRLVSYSMIDGSTIRLLETVDPNYQAKADTQYEIVDNFPPYYCQVWNNQILENPKTKEQVLYYPWELSFAVRNRTSNIYNNGYGTSELEILIQTITFILYGMQYNGNFFKQGSNPKGFFWVKGNVGQKAMNDFRMAWRQMTAGVQNAHKIPIFEGDQVKWEDMQKSNKDMEFQNWNEFLTILACSVFRIDPEEIGFHFKNQQAMYGQSGQKERIDHSREKGLKPLLVFMQTQINKYIISELDDKFEFVWTGIDLEDQEKILDSDVKKVSYGFVSMEDMFRKHSKRDFDPEKDTILNQVYAQIQQAKQFGGEESNQAIDQMNGGGDASKEGAQNPFDEYAKSQDNPFMDLLHNYVKEELIDK